MSEFTLNNKTDNLFLIGLSEIEQRLDAEFYLEDFDFTDFIKLRNIAKVKGGKRLPKGFYYSEEETDFLYLQVSNLDSDNEINWQTAKYISKEVFEILERYETVEGDLVFSIAGSIGKINVVKNIPEGKKVILTENASKIHFKKGVQVIPEFIELVLKTPLLQKQIKLNYIQTTIPKIGLDRIENLFIPEIPSLEIQRECLNYFKSAFETKQQKKREAKELLSSIDDYLLSELEINLPHVDNTLQNRMFTVLFNNLKSRQDPFFYLKEFQLIEDSIENSKWTVKYLKEIFEINRGGSPRPIHQFYTEDENGLNWIKIGDTKNDSKYINSTAQKIKPSGASSSRKVIPGDFLLSNSMSFGRPYIVNIEGYIHDGWLLFRPKTQSIDYDFLHSLLNNKLIYKLFSKATIGGVVENLNIDLVKNIRIPIPPFEKQKEIADYISNTRIKSKQFEEDAEEILNQAKLEVEKIILGE